MKKAIVLIMAAVFALAGVSAAAEDDGVYIGTEAELRALSARVAAGDSMEGVRVYLTADITLSAPFTPIGKDAETPFSGSFYGGGKRIKNLSVKGGSYAGLFGCVYRGKIDGVVLENAAVDGDNYVGLIAGRLYAYGGEAAVTGCRAQGRVSGVSYVGGIAGYAGAAAYGLYAKAEIGDCEFEGTVNGDIHTGGILGKGEARSSSSRAEVILEDCKTAGSVTANGRYGSLAGGVCGSLYSESNGGSSVTAARGCVSYASASAELDAAGGVCGAVGAEGYGASSGVFDCVAFGDAAAAALSGGICGKSEEAKDGVSEVKSCIAAGNVIGGSINAFSAGVGVSGCKSAAKGGVSYPSGVNPPVYTRGDANGDGKSDNLDAALVLMYDVGSAILGAAAIAACDMTGDGRIDNLDAAWILMTDAGLAPF